MPATRAATRPPCEQRRDRQHTESRRWISICGLTCVHCHFVREHDGVVVSSTWITARRIGARHFRNHRAAQLRYSRIDTITFPNLPGLEKKA
jgi:hypothetical protein